MDYTMLRQELLADPVTLGYGPLSNLAAANKLNATNTGRTVPRTAVTKNEILNAIVSSEWPASGVPQNKLVILFSVDTVDASNTNVRTLFADIFAAGSTTRTNLLALSTRSVSRAVEIGLGLVSEGDVGLARGGVW